MNERAWDVDQIVLDSHGAQQKLSSWDGSAKKHFSRKSIGDALRARIELAQTLRLSFETMHKRLAAGRWNESNAGAPEQWNRESALMVSDDALRGSCGSSKKDSRADHGAAHQSFSDWGPNCPSPSDDGMRHALSAYEGWISSLSSMHSSKQAFSAYEGRISSLNSMHSLKQAFSAYEGRISSLNSMHSSEQSFSGMITCDLSTGLAWGGQSDLNSRIYSQHEEIEPFVWKLKHVDPPPIR